MYRLKRLWKKFRQKPNPPPLPTQGRMAVRNRFHDIKDFITTDTPTIIDGGANIGTVIDRFLKQYPAPIIHAFEPRPEAVQQMQGKYANHPNIHIYDCGLGSENTTLSLNITRHLTSSSFFRPSSVNHHYHPDKTMTVQQTIEVPVKRLDSILDTDIDIMKLDLQGYELEALKGCGELLKRIKTITTEVEFVSLYDEQPLFADVDIFLRVQGFRLHNLYELWTQGDGQLTAGDAVYLNTHYFPR